jgi:ATP-dependent Lhr-like helicase
METFELLEPRIQKAIYKMSWTNFRPIQEKSIQYLIKNSNNLIISAPTASGKTEAAFLPIISNILKSENSGLKILYISPLKALINDQFLRIERLCKEINISIVKWHGDVSSKEKNDLLKKPDGILLITPESIEALFVNKYREIKNLFKNLDYIVIDEVHSFIENQRGNHLFSLLNRIETIIEKKIIKIALSATINNYISVQKWLNYENPESVKIIESEDKISSGLKGKINGYNLKDYNKELLLDLYNEIKFNKNLIFENHKNMLEKFCINIKEIAKKDNFSGNFYVHHGALSKELRETVEEKLKKEKNISVFCTSTLELGIDIGDINKIIFLNTLKSVSSTIQRLGRSGRGDGKSRNFKVFLEELEWNEKLNHQDKLRIKIIQSIAVVELLAREHWCEPLEINFGYSIIIHQILSLLGGTGAIEISQIYNLIIVKAFKSCIDKNKFLEIIKSLRDNEIIKQTQNKLITLDKKGENIVYNYKFYPAFSTLDNYEVNYSGNVIGFVDMRKELNIGDNIVIGGKQWLIINIIDRAKRIFVKYSDGGKPVFTSDSEFIIHKKIHEKMKEIYENKIPEIKYVNEKALLQLQEAKNEYKAFNDKFLLIFGGTKIQHTINFLFSKSLNKKEIELVEDIQIGFYFYKGKDFLLNAIKSIDICEKTFINFFQDVDIKKIQKLNKFDELLSKDLLVEEYIRTNFDIKGTKEILDKIINYYQ